MGVRAVGSDKLRERTLDVWQSKMRRKLSAEDAREIVENVVGFFSVLDDWQRAAGDSVLRAEEGR